MTVVSSVEDNAGERRSMRYQYAHASDRGLVREQNEDTVAVAEQAGFAIVADGMGGYNAGEVASGLAADFLVHHLIDDLEQMRTGRPIRPRVGAGLDASSSTSPAASASSSRLLHALLRARIDGANEAIIDVARREPACQGMGTTLAMLLFSNGGVTTVHLGDSRIYRMRQGVLSLLTRDHSLLQEQIDAGVITPREARESVNRNFVTRALGVDVVADPEINEYDVMPGDLYLLCSDGLPDMLSDGEIYDLLHREGAQSELDMTDSEFDRSFDRRVAEPALLDDVAAELIAAANARGGRDNVSVVLASVGWARDASLRTDDVEANTRPGRQPLDRRRA